MTSTHDFLSVAAVAGSEFLEDAETVVVDAVDRLRSIVDGPDFDADTRAEAAAHLAALEAAADEVRLALSHVELLRDRAAP